MESYNYLDAVKNDVLDYVKENGINVTAENREDVESELNDTLFCDDSVTGNASGSYWFNAHKAAECLCQCGQSHVADGLLLCRTRFLVRLQCKIKNFHQ